MSIVKMERVSVLLLQRDEQKMMRELRHLGWVHILRSDEQALPESLQASLHRPDSREAELTLQQRQVAQAIATLQRYAPEKSSLLAPRPTIGEQEFLDGDALAAQMQKVDEINALTKQLQQLNAQENELHTRDEALRPWETLDVPTAVTGTENTVFTCGTLPVYADFSAVQAALDARCDEAELWLVETTAEQQYVALLTHKSVYDTALAVLRKHGFSPAGLTAADTTPAQQRQALAEELAQVAQQRQEVTEALTQMKGVLSQLRLCADRLSSELWLQQQRKKLLSDGQVTVLEGFVPAEKKEALCQYLDSRICAYALREPTAEELEAVPVKLKNNFLTRSLNMVTEMYSLPSYDGVDPNPLMAPFFILFFGIMMADMGYGILMVLSAIIFLAKAKPVGGTRNFMELVLWCGISTFALGAMTGGFFGDFLPQLMKIIDPQSSFALPALFTPLDDTVAIMVGSLALGIVQIFTGMAVSVVYKCRRGQFLDALWDEIAWWCILIGVALMALGIGNVAGVPVLLVLGGVLLVTGSCVKNKGLGKFTALFGAIYNGVTGYFSDILSYIRLMALMLAGSVIAQVFNTLGAAFGNVVMFVIVAMIGNALNLALNLLGCYVHDLRLQYLEFFGRFYKEGGKPYTPLGYHTNYTTVMKED